MRFLSQNLLAHHTKEKDVNEKLGMVTHAHNPSCLGGRGKRMVVQGKPGQKHETVSEKAN